MSARESVMSALVGGAKTLNELAELLGGERKKLVWTLNDCIKQVLVERHNIDGEPGYRLTGAGKRWTPRGAQAGESGKPANTSAEPVRNSAENEHVAYSIPSAATILAQENASLRSRLDVTTEAYEREEANARIRGENLAPLTAERDREASSSRYLASRVESLHDQIAALLPEPWPIDPSDMDTSDIITAVAAALSNERALSAKLQALLDSARHECEHLRKAAGEDANINAAPAPASGYLVRAPKRKPRVFARGEAAVAAAMAAARNGSGRGEVFALVPMGHAKRGAEWVAK